MPISSALSSIATALRPRKGDQTRAAIVDAALAMASSEGLEGLTIGTLADRMRMSKSGVFAHFGSREDLQLAVLKEYVRRFVDEVLRPAVRKQRGLPRLEAILERWVAFLARELTQGCIMIAGAVEYDDRPGPQRDAMVEIIAGWQAEVLRAIRQAVEEGHLKRNVDAAQMVFEIYGVMLAMHQDARLLRSADSARRARIGLRRLIDDSRVGPRPDSRNPPRTTARKTGRNTK
ncbi:MAG TPA: TetR/AcrR family transcriptional regulator [Burkholderiaceae bacterium]|nr:TetR/AcrR family transcriptional regulator [Burkholderiaceae bacterium]